MEIYRKLFHYLLRLEFGKEIRMSQIEVHFMSVGVF
jgi:hypothetical protein